MPGHFFARHRISMAMSIISQHYPDGLNVQSTKMQILIVEPYFTGSHEAWAKGYAGHSCHDVQILSLPGCNWKWRMKGGAVTLAKQFMQKEYAPDLIIATDMLDLTTFMALTTKKTAGIPVVIYFHENQLTYPWLPTDRDLKHKRDDNYSFINFVSCLAADRIYFNSVYHMESFLDEVPRFLKHYRDYNELDSVDHIRAKSKVLYLGMDLKRFDESPRQELSPSRPPLILWNHRWEYDKNPNDFFEALFELALDGMEFQVAILGENFRNEPTEFLNAKERLGPRIVQFGYAESFEEYTKWLSLSDIVPVTSNQDFFGGSLVEAMYCGCYPLLPKRLAFPEHIPSDLHELFYYENQRDLVSRLRELILNIDRTRRQETKQFVERYDWAVAAPEYDKRMIKLLK
jgi:glycosyltransferase involved in cell wall biosynthesis